jgi:hypothetical protein
VGRLQTIQGGRVSKRYITRLDLHLSNEEINSFLQTWLFFGLLSEIFEDFVPDDFIRLSPTRPLVTTEPLPQYAQRWRTLLSQMLPGDRRLKIVKASKCLQEVFNFTSLHFETLEDAPTPRQEICLSINVLGHTLSYHLSEAHGLNQPGGPPLLPFNSGTLILRSRMIDQGWCPSDVA